MGRLVEETEALLQSKTTAEWIELLSRHKIPCGPVNFPEEVLDDPQVTENGYLIELEHEVLGGYTTYAPPVRMDGTPTAAQGPAPPLARHTEEVLREAGVSDDAIAALMDEGVAGARVAQR